MPEVGRKKILVVEDEPPIRSIIVKILSKASEYEVLSASDGAEAIKICEDRGPFDLLISDIQMPHLNGEELISRVIKRWPSTAILMLTAHRTDASVIRCLERGALDYLTKPLEVAKLLKTVDRVLDRREHLPIDLGIVNVKSDLRGWVELTAPNHFEYVERFQRFVQQLYSTAISRDDAEDIHLAINEIGQNAVEWGNRQDASKRIRLSYCLFKDRVVFKIEDEGEGFDASKLKDPSKDPLAHIMERISEGKRMGGYGVFMTKSLMDDVVYSERGNIVVMTKSFSSQRKPSAQPTLSSSLPPPPSPHSPKGTQ